MALGGWMSGAIFDLTGSYKAAFVNGILWNLVNVSIAAWLLRRSLMRPALADDDRQGGRMRARSARGKSRRRERFVHAGRRAPGARVVGLGARNRRRCGRRCRSARRRPCSSSPSSAPHLRRRAACCAACARRRDCRSRKWARRSTRPIPALLDLVENGKVALPFEIILRLASVLGRNDPISFVMRFTRSYNPDIWKTLEGLGVGRFAVQAGREREFANIYRASDAARKLKDEEFAAVLAFTRAAFDLAMAFRAGAPAKARSAARPRPRSKAR